MGAHAGLGHYIACDDPLSRGCSSRTNRHFSAPAASEEATATGWLKEPKTGKWACSECVSALRERIEEAKRSPDRKDERADDGGDTFGAAFIAFVAGGDPFVAGLVTLATDSTTLGVFAGIVAGQKAGDPAEAAEPLFSPGGGAYGGAGASGDIAPESDGDHDRREETAVPSETTAEAPAADDSASDSSSGGSDGGGSE